MTANLLGRLLLRLVSRYRVPATPLSLTSIYAAGVYGVWQGTGILSSGPERFTSPPLRIIGHHPIIWGLVALASGLLILYAIIRGHHFKLKALGLIGLSGWSLTFASSALNAYLTLPNAGPTGPPAYYFIAAFLLVLVWVDDERIVSASLTTPLDHPNPRVHRHLGSEPRRPTTGT